MHLYGTLKVEYKKKEIERKDSGGQVCPLVLFWRLEMSGKLY